MSLIDGNTINYDLELTSSYNCSVIIIQSIIYYLYQSYSIIFSRSVDYLSPCSIECRMYIIVQGKNDLLDFFKQFFLYI